MTSIKCPACGLTNWAAELNCKKCKKPLNQTPEEIKTEKYLADEKIFGEKWGLQEFSVEGTDPIPLSKLPAHLGVTGCIKLFTMIAVLILISIYGGGIVSDILPNFFGSKLKAVIGIGILGVPAIYLSLLSAWVLDRIFKLVKLSA